MISWRNSNSTETKLATSCGLLTTRQAADLIGLSERRVQELGAQGNLQRAGKKGNLYLFRRADIEAAIATQKAQRARLAERKKKWRVRT